MEDVMRSHRKYKRVISWRKHKVRLFQSIALISLTFVSSPTVARSQDTRYNINDTAYVLQSPRKPYSFRLVNTHPVVLRFELRPNDRYQVDGDKGKVVERVEMRDTKNYDYGTDIWQQFRLKVIRVDATSRFTILGQWHGENINNRSPILSFEMAKSQEFMIKIRSDPDSNSVASPPARDVYIDKKFTLGVWHKFDIHLDLDWKDGKLDVFRDNKKVAHFNGPIGYNEKKGPYWKFGVYRGGGQKSTIVEYSDMRITARPK